MRAKDVPRGIEAAPTRTVPLVPSSGSAAQRLIRVAADWFLADGRPWTAAVAMLCAVVLLAAAPMIAGSVTHRGHKASPSGVSGAPTTNLPPFVCASEGMGSGNAPSGVASIGGFTTVTTSGYDRLVVLFSGAIPTGDIELRPETQTQLNATLGTARPTLAGTNAILVIIQGAKLDPSHRVPTDIKPNLPALKEVTATENAGDVVEVSLGVRGSGCYRTLLVSDPNRLIVDVPSR